MALHSDQYRGSPVAQVAGAAQRFVPSVTVPYSHCVCVEQFAMTDLSSADSELRFQMEEAGVSPATQKKFYDLGVTSLRIFGGLEESREELRAVFKDDFGLNPAGNIEIRKEVSKLLCVWESARMQRKCQEQNRQDAKLGVQQRLVQNTEYAAMRAAVETMHGRSLKDREVPSKSLIALKLEQVEDGAPVAEDLREVTSLEDAHVEAYGAVIDPASQTLRIRPGKATTTPPATPEDLRLRHRRLGLAWDFVRSRHSTRTWLLNSSVDTLRLLSDHVLGSHVAGVKTADGCVPTWSQVLTYELELRKAAYRFVRDGTCACLNAATEKVIDSSDLLNLHFIIPITLGKRQACSGQDGLVFRRQPLTLWAETSRVLARASAHSRGNVSGARLREPLKQHAFVSSTTTRWLPCGQELTI